MNAPFFSIVIPTFNRPRQLSACLSALNRIEYSNDLYEVLVVDDGGAASLENVVRHWRDSFNIRLLRQQNKGPGGARNFGASHARGEFLVFTDDDCAPAPDFLKHLAQRFAQTPDALVGGKTINALPHNIYSQASQLLIDFLYDFYNVKPDGAHFFTSNNFALRAESFRDFGGFDVRFTRAAAEDREFCDRWQRQKKRAVYAPEVVIFHAHHLSLRALWRQHFAYGRGAAQFHRARIEYSKGFKPDLNFYRKLVIFPLTQPLPRPTQLRLCALMLWMQTANFAGFLQEEKQQRARD